MDANDSLSLLELKVLPHHSQVTDFLARSEQLVALAVQILDHQDCPRLLQLTHPNLTYLVILVWLQLHQYPIRHFAFVWLICRLGAIREHEVHSTGPYVLAIVDARPLVAHYPLVKRQRGSRWIEAIGLVWVGVDEGSQASMEFVFTTEATWLVEFVSMGTEDGIEGRRDVQLEQLGLGGFIMRLLKGQRVGLGGSGNQIRFFFEDCCYLKLQVGIVGVALLLQTPQ